MNTHPTTLDVRHELPCAAVTASGWRCGSRSSRVRDGHPCCVTHDRDGVQFALWTGGKGKHASKAYWRGTPGNTIQQLV